MGAGSVLLARLTFFDEIGAVLFHRGPEVPCPEDSCCHRFWARVVSACAFVYFFHNVGRLIVRDASE